MLTSSVILHCSQYRSKGFADIAALMILVVGGIIYAYVAVSEKIEDAELKKENAFKHKIRIVEKEIYSIQKSAEKEISTTQRKIQTAKDSFDGEILRIGQQMDTNIARTNEIKARIRDIESESEKVAEHSQALQRRLDRLKISQQTVSDRRETEITELLRKLAVAEESRLVSEAVELASQKRLTSLREDESALMVELNELKQYHGIEGFDSPRPESKSGLTGSVYDF